MDKVWKDAGIAITLGLVIPAVLLGLMVSVAEPIEVPKESPEPVTQATHPQDETIQPQDAEVLVLTQSGEVVTMALNDYLTGVVLGEMPVSFEEEALKAQAVVARTYTIRAMNGASKHEQAAVCTNSSCCQSYIETEAYKNKGGKSEDVGRVRSYIEQTSQEVLTYDGKLIEATYFSCSGGSTEDAVAVWGTDVPYLQAVASPGEEHAAHYTDTVTFSADEFRSRMGLELSGEPSVWFGEVTYTDGGGVASLEVGGQVFSGTKLRSLLGLRSTAFEVVADASSITITTRGFGHRVGMSQYGADAMAASGNTYKEILAYYYQGTELIQYAD